MIYREFSAGFDNSFGVMRNEGRSGLPEHDLPAAYGWIECLHQPERTSYFRPAPLGGLLLELIRRRPRTGLLTLTLAVFLASCAYQPEPEAFDPPGFLLGAVHGFTMAFSLIAEIFSDVRIYAFPNLGGWYDLGYVIGAGLFLGGSGVGSTRNA